MKDQHRKLIEELMYNAEVAKKPLEQRLADLTVWFFNNKDDLPRDNLAARQLFLEKTVWVLIEIAALQAERLHELEGASARAHLWLPSGMRHSNGQEFK